MKVNEINKVISGAVNRSGFADILAKQRSTNFTGNDRDPKVEDAAKKFEGMFLAYLMNEMMKSTGDGFMGKGLSGDIFKSLFAQQISEQLSSGRGMGLSDMVYEYFEKNGMTVSVDKSSEEK